eukprot:g6608.t1
MSRCVFVYCELLKKGFVTRLSSDQRLSSLYEQVREVFTTGTEFELLTVDLSDSVVSENWILPPFLKIKDLHFNEPLYVKAVVRKKAANGVLSTTGPAVSPESATPDSTAVAVELTDEENVPVVSENDKVQNKRSSLESTKKPSVATSTIKSPTERQRMTSRSVKKLKSQEGGEMKEGKGKKRQSTSMSSIGSNKAIVKNTNEPPVKKERLKVRAVMLVMLIC